MHYNSAVMGKQALEDEFNSAGCIITALKLINHAALEDEFISAGCIITALKLINQRWKANLSALDA
jgi:hypothetical protein